MTQREGRILRQGNKNDFVYIYRYITEGSFDAYSWQLLETKQRFISGLLSGSITERSGSDIENTVLDYAEIKALAVGNPLVKERVETANSYTRYLTLQRKVIETRIQLEKELKELPGKILRQRERIKNCNADIEAYEKSYEEYEEGERKEIREAIFQAVLENEFVSKETYLMTYQGFSIILPANMKMKQPYIWLQNNGKYYVEIGTSKIGGLIRIDNFLERLDKYLEECETNLQKLIDRETSIQKELQRNESYTDEIEACKKKLEEIDEKLGIKK